MAERDPQIGDGRAASAYEADYGAWVASQASLLRAGRHQELDHDRLIDEVESLGRFDYAAFVSAVEVVLVHMLKWDGQPGKRTASWVASIVEHRRRIEHSLRDNPSYRPRIPDAMERAFETATAKAAVETDLPLSAFPSHNPFDWEAITTRPYHLPA